MTNSRLCPLLTVKALAKVTPYQVPNTAYKLIYGNQAVISTYPSLQAKELPPQAKMPIGAIAIAKAEPVVATREPFIQQFNVLLQHLADWKLADSKYNLPIEHLKNTLFLPAMTMTVTIKPPLNGDKRLIFRIMVNNHTFYCHKCSNFC